MNKISIVCWGDSITAAREVASADRWPVLLEKMLLKRFPDADISVVNSGVGGETSREGLARFENDVLLHKPDFVTCEFGNDTIFRTGKHVPVEEFEKNLKKAAQLLASRGGKMIFMTFPPFNDDDWYPWASALICKENLDTYKKFGGINKFCQQYREKTRLLAKELSLPLVDLYGILKASSANPVMESPTQPDGVHLTERGNELAALAVFDTLVTLI